MNLTVSPQIRIIALVGLLAAAGLAASMFVLGGSGNKAQTVAVSTPVRHRPATTPNTPARHATTPRTAAHTPAQSHTGSPAKPQNRRKSAGFHGNPVSAQLPEALQWQLAHPKLDAVN